MPNTQTEPMNMTLPAALAAERQGAVAILRLSRRHKRNARDDQTITGIEKFFSMLPDGIGAVPLCGDGGHLSADRGSKMKRT